MNRILRKVYCEMKEEEDNEIECMEKSKEVKTMSQMDVFKLYMRSQEGLMKKAGITALLVVGTVSLIFLSGNIWLGLGIWCMMMFIDSNIGYRMSD